MVLEVVRRERQTSRNARYGSGIACRKHSPRRWQLVGALGAGIEVIAGLRDVRETVVLSCTRMLFMVIERFRPGRVDDVYRRFREHGRLAPTGLEYVSSWVDLEFSRCFQVMATADRALLDEWIAQWADLVDFEVIPVRESADAAAVRAAASRAAAFEA